MRLILMRHGQTHHNVLGISMGQGIDGPLNDEGIEQARRAAERLRAEPVSHAYFSDLQRAVHTAEIILQYHHPIAKTPTPALRERNLGIYEGRPNTEWKAAMLKAPLPFHLFTPAGGESYQDLYVRVSTFYEDLLQSHGPETVLVVSHTGAVTMLLLRILKVPITKDAYERFKPGNTAITILECTRGVTPRILLLNAIDHLDTPIESEAA